MLLSSKLLWCTQLKLFYSIITKKFMVYVDPWYEMYNLGNSYKINIVWNHGGSFNLSKKVWQ